MIVYSLFSILAQSDKDNNNRQQMQQQYYYWPGPHGPSPYNMYAHGHGPPQYPYNMNMYGHGQNIWPQHHGPNPYGMPTGNVTPRRRKRGDNDEYENEVPNAEPMDDDVNTRNKLFSDYDGYGDDGDDNDDSPHKVV